jgi:hypothetical protein
MNPRVEKVRPADDYRLILKFANGEILVFDVGPYLNIGIFRELRMRTSFGQSGSSWVVFNGREDKTSVPTLCIWIAFRWSDERQREMQY